MISMMKEQITLLIHFLYDSIMFRTVIPHLHFIPHKITHVRYNTEISYRLYHAHAQLKLLRNITAIINRTLIGQ